MGKIDKKNEQEKVRYKVTAMGSLGLLALGHKGIELWHEAIRKNNRENEK